MKLLVLNNLSSGYGDNAVYDFIRTYSKTGDEVCIRCVDADSSFSDALADAGEFDAVVASGGDGTHSAVCYLLRNSDIPILPYPAGTANLLCQNIMSPIEPFALAQLVRDGKCLDFDLGGITTSEGSHGFSMMAGCGYDATMMADARRDKKRWGPAAYFKAAFQNPNPQVAHLKVTVDGVTHEHEGVGVMLVNFSKIQFDISITPRNLPNDGALDVLVLTTQTAWDLLPTALGAAFDHSGESLEASNALVFYRGREIRVESDPELLVQYDGEPLEAHTPFTASVLPAACKLIVSDDGYKIFTQA